MSVCCCNQDFFFFLVGTCKLYWVQIILPNVHWILIFMILFLPVASQCQLIGSGAAVRMMLSTQHFPGCITRPVAVLRVSQENPIPRQNAIVISCHKVYYHMHVICYLSAVHMSLLQTKNSVWLNTLNDVKTHLRSSNSALSLMVE